MARCARAADRGDLRERSRSRVRSIRRDVRREFRSSRAVLVWTAWIATLLLSKLPLVIARDLLGSDIPWIVPIWIGIAVLFYAATYIWHTLEPLRRYFIIMGVILVITAWLDPILRATAVWHAFFDSQSQMVILFAERILIGVEALIVISCLFLLGIKRRDSFIEVGNLKAPVAGRSAPTRKRPLTWLVFGPLMAVLLGSLFFVFLNSQFPGAASSYRSVLPLLPLILLSAMLNAFGEEAMYRAAPLATIVSPVGAGQALWMTSVWFGLGHYYGGIPSGPIGFIQSGLLGLLLGKAMLDTRGMAWSWIIHVVLDTVIYTTIAMIAISS